MLAPPVLLIGVLVAGCSVPNLTQPDEEAVAESQLVKVAGLTFSRPELEWLVLDAHWLLPENAVHVKATEVARSLGLTKRQFEAVFDTVDLYVVDNKRNGRGVFDLVTVDHLDRAVAGQGELEQRLRAAGAKRLSFQQVSTPVGEASVTTYTMGKGKRRVFARTAVLDVDGEVDITVAASRAARADEILDGVLATLAADGSRT